MRFRDLTGLAAALVVLSACQTDSNVGEGPLELSPQVAAGYEEFKKLDNPTYFAVSPDGRNFGYSYCRDFGCVGRLPSTALSACNRRRPKNDCRIYAHKDKVLWVYPDEEPIDGLTAQDYIGEGFLHLRRNARDEYRRWENSLNPAYFAVSSDGASSAYSTCRSAVGCLDSSTLQDALRRCRTDFRSASPEKDGRCLIYGIDGEVVWRFPDTVPDGMSFKEAAGDFSRAEISGGWHPRGYLVSGAVYTQTGFGYGGVELIGLPEHGDCNGLFQRTHFNGGAWQADCSGGDGFSGVFRLDYAQRTISFTAEKVGENLLSFAANLPRFRLSFLELSQEHAPDALEVRWAGAGAGDGEFYPNASMGQGALVFSTASGSGTCVGTYLQTYAFGGVWKADCGDEATLAGEFRLERDGDGWTGEARDSEGRKLTLRAAARQTDTGS